LLVVWSITRHRDPHLHIDCSSPIEELMPSLAGLTLATAVDGNTVEIFENGAYFEVLLAEIRSAKRSASGSRRSAWARSRPRAGSATSGSASRIRVYKE
jgi:hypothetical protein